jgi:signal transduction histidine kinase
MRSIYTRLLLSTLAMFAFTALSFVVILRANVYANFDRGGSLANNVNRELQGAVRAYRTGGPRSLRSFLADLQRNYPRTRRHLVDFRARDLITSEDLSSLLSNARIGRSRFWTGPVLIARSTDDHRFWLILATSGPFMTKSLALVCLGVFLAIALAMWAVAFQFASPLKQLSKIVRRFGAGDLGARVQSKRRDEIGDVGHAFDDMAHRIQTLLTAERRLLQDISHELRSPLARLSFAIELARTASDRELAAARLNREAQRLTNLVESLLHVTQAEGDLASCNLEPLVLDSVIADIIEDCTIEANARGCHLRVLGSSDAIVRADRELLRRAVENVVRNAIVHAPEGSHIEVDVHSSATSASVSVRDFGPGVPSNALTDIFKPFYRVDEARNSSKGGIGLGLAIVQRAVNIHHGSVWAENASPGLRVCMDLPLETVAV